MRSALNDPMLRLRKETAWLLMEFLQAVRNREYGRREQLACEMAVVRLHDAWTRFCRDIVIVSALGNTNTLSGTRLARCTSAITDRNSVVVYLLSKYKKRRYEPRWGDVQECLDAANLLGLTNFTTIAAGLGAANSPAEEIRHVRNYYAHRKDGSALKAMGTGLFPLVKKPEVAELAKYTPGGQMVIESWVQRLMAVATASIQ